MADTRNQERKLKEAEMDANRTLREQVETLRRERDDLLEQHTVYVENAVATIAAQKAAPDRGEALAARIAAWKPSGQYPHPMYATALAGEAPLTANAIRAALALASKAS